MDIYSTCALEEITQKQRKSFKPTFLYIKRCKNNGILYFGKTNSRHPEKYLGSGTLWLKSVKKYGKESIETLWYCLFTDIDELRDFALKFSVQEMIIESELWANLIPENGLQGGGLNRTGMLTSDKTKAKMSSNTKNYWESLSEIQRNEISDNRKNAWEDLPEDEKENRLKHLKNMTAETKAKMSIAKQNMSEETRKKMSESQKKMSPENRKKLTAAQQAGRLRKKLLIVLQLVHS
jgi:hypothetical protein